MKKLIALCVTLIAFIALGFTAGFLRQPETAKEETREAPPQSQVTTSMPIDTADGFLYRDSGSMNEQLPFDYNSDSTQLIVFEDGRDSTAQYIYLTNYKIVEWKLRPVCDSFLEITLPVNPRTIANHSIQSHFTFRWRWGVKITPMKGVTK